MIISWFSGGITSAVACKVAQQSYERVIPVFIETGSHHDDMPRFIKDCGEWYQTKVLIIQDKKYKDHFDLVEKLKTTNFVSGAECSRTLKKKMRQKFEKLVHYDGQIFGFEFAKKEINRAVRFKEQNPDAKPIYPLIDKQLNKPNCLEIVERAGIRKPRMYELGYSNNNCLMCVKGGQGYFNKMRKDFPEQFDRMAKIERKIKRTCMKAYLDELDPEAGRDQKMIMPECDLFCEIEAADILAEETEKILSGEQPFK